MIESVSLNKAFATHSELFRELKRAEKELIQNKKSCVLKSAERGQISNVNFINKDTQADKSVFKEGLVYPVINTTNYLDSHDDVHFPNIWNKSLKEQQDNIFFRDTHSTSLRDIIAWPHDFKAFVQTVDWSMVGKNFAGQTQALIFEIDVTKITHDVALEIFAKKRPVLGSVAMQYVKIELAVNSTEKDYITNKRLWDSKINSIANIDQANELKYFFAVTEAKIAGEGSILTNPSNPATQIVYPESMQPPTVGTAKEEPLLSTPSIADLIKYSLTKF